MTVFIFLQMRKAEAEQDAVFAAALFEEDRVLLEKMAGNETADKHYARKLQKDEVKSVTSLSSKLLKSWCVRGVTKAGRAKFA